MLKRDAVVFFIGQCRIFKHSHVITVSRLVVTGGKIKTHLGNLVHFTNVTFTEWGVVININAH